MKDKMMVIRIDSETKEEFDRALRILNETITGNISKHIKRQIKKAEAIKKNPRLTTD